MDHNIGREIIRMSTSLFLTNNKGSESGLNRSGAESIEPGQDIAAEAVCRNLRGL